MMEKTKQFDVLYLGDWAFHVGPFFIETPFRMESKDADLHFYGQRVVDALEPIAMVESKANWDLYRMAPGKFEDYLEKVDCVIVSDVEAKNFHLYPSFFNRAQRKKEIITFPDRLRLLEEWIEAGGGMMMLGGWLAFSGVQGNAGWGRCRMTPTLPIECLLVEDLVESSEGFTFEVLIPDHPAVKGLPWETCPPIFGYNEVKAKPGSEVIMRIKETGDPILVAGSHGKGRILTYMSDPVPHWGINLELWEGYDGFWQQSLRWVTNND